MHWEQVDEGRRLVDYCTVFVRSLGTLCFPNSSKSALDSGRAVCKQNRVHYHQSFIVVDAKCDLNLTLKPLSSHRRLPRVNDRQRLRQERRGRSALISFVPRTTLNSHGRGVKPSPCIALQLGFNVRGVRRLYVLSILFPGLHTFLRLALT